MKNQRHTTTRRFGAIGIVLGLVLALAAPVLATDYTWTSTASQSSGYWTNGVLWGNIVSGYPGNAADSPNAFLTNLVGTANGFYTNVLNSSLGYPIGSIVVSNSNNGQAWLVVTNATLATESLILGGGGALRVDTGSSLFVTNAASNAQLIVGQGGGGRGTLTFNGGTLFVNQLLSSNNVNGVVTNSIFTTIGTGATLITSNGANQLAASIVIPVINNNFNINGTWTMLGGTNLVASGGDVNPYGYTYVTVGSVLVSNGAKFFNNDTGVRMQWSSKMTVAGAGSVITNGGFGLGVGIAGDFNNLTIADGGVYVTPLSSIGASGGTSNSVLVTGPGSVWSNFGSGSGYSDLPMSGASSSLTISNGGYVYVASSSINSSLGIGDTGGGAGVSNWVLVTGSGSILTNKGNLGIGWFTSYNTLTIANSGTVWDTTAHIGQRVNGQHDNMVTVTDTGSVWRNSGAVNIGGELAGAYKNNYNNQIIVSNGALVTSVGLNIGSGLSGTNNNNTVTITGPGSTWTNTGATAISLTNSAFNTLTVTNGGGYYGGGAVVVGYGPGANSNNYNVGGAGTLSVASNGLITVGYLGGSFNTMTVTNANVWSQGLAIGSGSSNNLVTVGPNSTWDLRSGALTWGVGPSTNNNLWVDPSITLSNVGGLTLGEAGQTFLLTNNLLTVAGTNFIAVTLSGGGLSVGSNTQVKGVSLTVSNQTYNGNAASFVGNGSSSNTLAILTNTVWNAGAGNLTIGSGATTGNVFLVNGGLVTNVGFLYIGSGGTSIGNSLIVTNGGKLFDSNVQFNGLRNSATVTGAGSIWSNAAYSWMGGNSGGDTLTVADGGKAFINVNYLVVGYSGTMSNAVTVTGTGSLFKISGSFNLGSWSAGNGSLNSLVISNGGGMVVNGFQIGNAGGNHSNSVVVTGPGSVLTNNASNVFYVGATGDAANNLLIANGGSVVNADLVTIGQGGGVNNFSNSVLVTGSGSVWNNANTMFVGIYAAYSMLTIANSGKVVNTSAYIGGNGNGSGGYLMLTSNNTATVTDTGSLWQVNGGLYVGGNPAYASNSVNNTLIISNGALVTSTSAMVGVFSNAVNNIATITGPGSTWSNTGTMIIGNTNAWVNNLSIVNGGAYYGGGALTVGLGAGATNNFLVVDGGSQPSPASTVLSNNGLITVGGPNSQFNTMTAANAKLWSTGLTIGNGASNNSVTVSAAALWSLTGNNLTVGSGVATGNVLTINTGGSVTGAAKVIVGTAATASGNSVRLNGGLLEANTLSNFVGGSGNTISNVGGVYQFTTNSPTIVPNGFGNIALTGGTIAFRAITNADVNSSQGGGALSNLQFAGANTFMLNAASNTTAASQAYTFQQVGSNPSNFAGLAMINGQTAYRNGGATIGATGSLLVRDTTASFTDVVTNQGVAVLLNSTETFGGGLVNQGTVTNYNNNSFTGLLTMDNGTFVTAGGPAQSLPGVVNLQGAATFDTTGGNLLLAGGLTNAGNLAKIGTGNLVLPTANTFSGDTRPVAGAVVLGDSYAVSNSTVNLAAGDTGSLVFSNNGAYTLGGLKGGSGRTLALTGSDNNPVALTVGNNGQNATFGGSISGGGSITKIGAGIQVFSGPNSYSGDTYINAGQLVLADPAAAANSLVAVNVNNGLAFSNATGFAIAGLTGSGNIGLVNVGGAGIGLTVSNTDNSLTYSGVMSGSGSLTKAGNGTFELTGNNTFNGTVGVSAGKLLVNGSLAGGSPLTLSADATLAGSGTVGRVVGGAGQVSPGNSPGLLTVNQLDPSGGTGFEFEFTQLSPNFGNLGAIGNDVLRITNATPFTVALGLSNTVNLVVTAPLTAGVINYLRGGFYSDSGAMFDPTINGATYNLFIDDGGPLAFVHTVVETTPWGTGRILEIGVWGKMIPEPQVVMFWLTGAATLYAARRRMQRRK